MDATFFATQAEFRHWLEKNHDQARELLLGFYKTKSDQKGITYAEALDEALCFGWIDGVRKRIDGDRFSIRFSPRKPQSIWSLVNVRKVEELIRQGRMQPPGMQAFEARDEKKTGIYAFEAARGLDAAAEKEFRAHKEAWDFYQKQAPFYRKTIAHWVTSAKKEETRARRLAQLIEHSEKGVRVGLLTGPGTKKSG